MIKVNGIEVTKGCTVKFRCGGEAVVEKANGNEIKFEGCSIANVWDGCSSYYSGEKTPFDIIEVIPPVFDWDTVEQGMAFKDNYGNTCYYVGDDFSCNTHVIVSNNDNCTDLDCVLKKTLTRAPERDIEVKK